MGNNVRFQSQASDSYEANKAMKLKCEKTPTIVNVDL